MTRSQAPRQPVVDYRTLAELRYHIRRFLRAREDAARAVGVEPQHYLLLLQIKGLEDERPTTVGALAERLQLRHHTVVELVDRLAARAMVARRRAPLDRRQVVVELRPAGHAVLKRLALYSVAELRTEGPALVTALTRLIGRARTARRIRPRRAPRSARRAVARRTGDRLIAISRQGSTGPRASSATGSGSAARQIRPPATTSASPHAGTRSSGLRSPFASG